MLRKDPIITDHLYHIFNRGVNKGDIFFEVDDYKRFLRVAAYYKTNSKKYSDYPDTGSGKDLPKVQVLAYCLMPNHFHFLIKQLADGGITWYMQHLANSYAHYIHTKYKRVGPLFESRFKNVLIESDEQLMHVSRYIHLNPLVSGVVSDLKGYKWSSYESYIGDSKDELCEPEPVIGYFQSKENYEKFVLDQANYGRELEKIKHLTIDSE